MTNFKNFVESCSAVTRNPNLSPGAKALYVYFLTNPGNHRETVCKEMNISKDTFYRYIKELKDSGLFRTEYFNTRGASKKCTYKALLLDRKEDSKKIVSVKTDSEKPESLEEILKDNNININNNINNSSLQVNNTIPDKKNKYTNLSSSRKPAVKNPPLGGETAKPGQDLSQAAERDAERDVKDVEVGKQPIKPAEVKKQPVKAEETSRPAGNSTGMVEAYTFYSAGFSVPKWVVLKCKEQVAERLKIPVSLSSLLFKRCQNDVSLVSNVLYQIENAKKTVRNVRAYLVTVLKPDNWEIFKDNVSSGFIAGIKPDREGTIEFLRWFFGRKNPMLVSTA